MITNRNYSILLLLFLASFSAFGQEKVKKKIARPDIPGSFMVDIGVTRGAHNPNNFSQGLWGSRTLNVYYQYPLRILNSNFSFNPGIGLGFDRFKLKNNYTLTSSDGDQTYELVAANTTLSTSATVHKSMIITDYLDFPMDFRYDTRPEDRSRSFSVSLGGRFGVLYNNFTKIKYSEFGDRKMIKDKESHGINPIRYGLYARVGAGGFNWFFQYNISPFFSSDKGPDKTKMNSMTFGISIGGL